MYNPTSFNYDPNANTDDGSCVPIIYGCTDPTSFNYDSTKNTDDGSDVSAESTDVLIQLSSITAHCQIQMTEVVNHSFTDVWILQSLNYDIDNTNQVSATDFTNPCIPIVYGCTDSTSFNYGPEC